MRYRWIIKHDDIKEVMGTLAANNIRVTAKAYMSGVGPLFSFKTQVDVRQYVHNKLVTWWEEKF